MSACPNCGAISKPTDRFCNTCGRPVLPQQGSPFVQAPSPPRAPPPAAYGAPPSPIAPQPAYAPAPPPAASWGAAPSPRCQQGHEIAAGLNYCNYGHPIALDGVQFAGNAQPRGAEPSGGGAYGGPRVLRGFLVSFQGNPQGEFWSLHSGGKLIVGRANSGEVLDVPLPDATTSSRHAALTCDPSGSILLEDTGSTNGTFVNDEHLGFNGRRELRDGDRVRFGGYSAIIKILPRS